MSKVSKPQLKLRIVLLDPPPDVRFRLQRGRDGLTTAISETSDKLVFELSVEVADPQALPPRLTGEYAQGPATGRFIYINSGTSAGDPSSCWTRRVKVHLSGITADLIEQHLSKPGSILEAHIAGRAKDGGPCCASVPFLVPWLLSESN